MITLSTLLSAWLGSEILFTAMAAIGISPKIAGGITLATKLFPHIKTLVDIANSRELTEHEKAVVENSRRQMMRDIGGPMDFP